MGSMWKLGYVFNPDCLVLVPRPKPEIQKTQALYTGGLRQEDGPPADKITPPPALRVLYSAGTPECLGSVY